MAMHSGEGAAPRGGGGGGGGELPIKSDGGSEC